MEIGHTILGPLPSSGRRFHCFSQYILSSLVSRDNVNFRIPSRLSLWCIRSWIIILSGCVVCRVVTQVHCWHCLMDGWLSHREMRWAPEMVRANHNISDILCFNVFSKLNFSTFSHGIHQANQTVKHFNILFFAFDIMYTLRKEKKKSKYDPK